MKYLHCMLIVLAALLLAVVPAFASASAQAASPAVPVEILPQSEGMIYMSDAIEAAKGTLAVLPADCLIRGELVRMSDGSCQWIVTIFDLANFADGWCICVDAASGAVLTSDVTKIGYFDTVNARWQAAKGVEALWSLEDKMLFDTLYTIQPTYGLPLEGDLSQGEALGKAMAAVGMNGAGEFQIGYGYIMGAGETSGVWEVYFVQGDELIYKVNLDAVSGDILLIEPDEEGNG